jgi:hypothetical protein
LAAGGFADAGGAVFACWANAGPEEAIATSGKSRTAVASRTAFPNSERGFMKTSLIDAARTTARSSV